MRRRARGVVVVSTAAALLGACALFTDLNDLSKGSVDAGPERSDATSPGEDASVDVALPPLSDAGATGCDASRVVVESFTSSLGEFVAKSDDNDIYPHVETFAGAGPVAVLFPKIVVPPEAGTDGGPDDPQLFSTVNAIWLKTPAPLSSFDATIDVRVDCTNQDSCADGVVVAWLETSNLSLLPGSGSGHVAGLPQGVRGAGVVLDNFVNSPPEPPDPPSPSLQIIELDPTKTVGLYPWHVATTPFAFLGAWHTLTIQVRGDRVKVFVDGLEKLSGVIPELSSGIFGITAGTGGMTDAVAVRNLSASFYDCKP